MLDSLPLKMNWGTPLGEGIINWTNRVSAAGKSMSEQTQVILDIVVQMQSPI